VSHNLNKLTVKAIDAIKTPGKHGDGGGLFLFVEKTGAKRWVHIYPFAGRRREMGLGSLVALTLATSEPSPISRRRPAKGTCG